VTAAFAAVALAAASLAVFTPLYETNDDVMMNLIASGLAVTDRPDEHLLFTNVALGLPLKWLYGRWPAVPWYGGSQFAALTCAAGGIAYALLRVDPSPGQGAVVLLFFGLAAVPCLAEVQFTKTAALASAAGLLLLLAPLRGAAPWPRAADVAAGALVVLGSLVRFQGFLLAAVVVAPVAAAGALADPKAAARRGAPLAAAVAAAVALYAFDRAYYACDDGWKDFHTYNALRAEFTDYNHFPYTRETKPAYDAVGWDELNLEMLRYWFHADPERYGLPKLRQIAATVPAVPPHTLGAALGGTLKSLGGYPNTLRLLAAIPVAALLAGGGWRRLVLPGTTLAFTLGLTLALGWFLWTPDRVVFSLFACALAATGLRPPAAASAPRSTSRAGVAVRLVAGAAGTLLVALTVSNLSRADRDHAEQRVAARRLMRDLAPRPDQLFVVRGDSLPLEYLVLPLSDPAVLRPFRCLALSTLVPTPITARRLQEFALGDVFPALWSRDDVFLVSGPIFLPVCQHYVWRYYGVYLHFEEKFIREGKAGAYIVRGRARGRAPAAGRPPASANPTRPVPRRGAGGP
jgi:hypothetical protein